MPALKPTNLTATVTWLGIVTSADRKELVAETRAALDLTFAGITGSVHEGATRPSCSRVTAQYKRGTEIRNERQLSIVSEEELAQIAAALGLARIDPARLGATMVLRGLPDFSHLPPSSRLQAPSGATVMVDMQNRPCQFPARSIEAVEPGKGKGFKRAAEGRRGVTASVAREGRVAVGDVLTLHLPDQRAWRPET
ncbi:MOSC domain-containing protein [Maliponia aquimaris]|uniref:Putative metal-sulfur cluster biosynthesis proteins YuaD n=1 Tax=Maliponia aquimaris TaxID=1673631 RepID=A0A238KBG5_9RHOB|nr:MOSC domain-containing protein [Maliponia aquimaris]SMX40189.1 Putative metal-sulfur cluster biosynthesis proteins YuaD [Maliponia aquimaris]